MTFIDYESRSSAKSLPRRYAAICGALALTTPELEDLARNLTILEVRKLLRSGFVMPSFPADGRGPGYDFWAQLVADYPADLYIIDPMRSFHATDEKDSLIERLLMHTRLLFGSASVIVSHHMRKATEATTGAAASGGEGKGGGSIHLDSDMRAWSDGSRGSVAIKAHADMIVCQERRTQRETEVVWLGAFQKDAADIEPFTLYETGPETFTWRVGTELPTHLKRAHSTLLSRASTLHSRSDGIAALRAAGVSTSTCYRLWHELRQKGFVTENLEARTITIRTKAERTTTKILHDGAHDGAERE